MKPDFRRQQDLLVPEEFTLPVRIIGVGGIGSWVALCISKMGCLNPTLVDSDHAEPHNIPNQFYRVEGDIGRPKVEALREHLKVFSGAEAEIICAKAPSDNVPLDGIVISGVDSMQARKEIWKAIRWNPQVSYYLDGRMGAFILELYTIRPCDEEDVAFYEETLVGDDEVPDLVCTAQAIAFTVFSMAGEVGAQVYKILKREPFPWKIWRDMLTGVYLTETASERKECE